MIGSIIYLAIVVIVIAGMWKTFEKAGQPGWGCIIPIYNIYLMTKIAAKPAWWVIMFFIPLVNIVFAIMLYNEIAKKIRSGNRLYHRSDSFTFRFLPDFRFR